jgi:hypothetical protein
MYELTVAFSYGDGEVARTQETGFQQTGGNASTAFSPTSRYVSNTSSKASYSAKGAYVVSTFVARYGFPHFGYVVHDLIP